MYIENYIKRTVDNLIKRQGTTDPEKLIRSKKNVTFDYLPLPKNIGGFYKYISSKRQVLGVAENLNGYAKQITLYHELCHCELKHKGYILLNRTTISNIKEEYEAELFSAYFFKLHNGIIRENINNFTIPLRTKKAIYIFL